MKCRKTLPILLKEQHILLIGGGKVALQKAEVLAENNISFSIIAKEVHPKIYTLCNDIQKKAFKTQDIKDTLVVIDATGNDEVTEKLLEYKKKHPILLNVVDIPQCCDFYFMALTKNAPLQIAVSSSGASPTAAKYFRDKCQALIPDDLTTFLEELQTQRDQGVIEINKTLQTIENMTVKAYLVGCGLGDPDLLTIKAFNIIKNVDVVLYDNLISNEIMSIVPQDTTKVFVGKEKGFHSKSQEEINKLICKYIKQGYSVARLKSGDPFIFGRGAEELIYLTKKGISTEVIPGISSAVSGPLMANIPITARDYSNAFTVVSAHLKDNSINLEWVPMLENKDHTVIVLMGLTRIPDIVQKAKTLDIDMDTPCAIISNASRENQSVQVGTLDNISVLSLEAKRPAIIVFGKVVDFLHELEKHFIH
ncbi:uroporphyrinogen-III C-methyltransferase [Sulfurovum sp. zt1-1]|uniref:Uroporphyrinogen-III C-methyltransferase n=1 Tax=Sulfurovum zhangzhouensis TaxID=3019067 RepID=A0ABT7R104_9BACT|nr:uroporphyrinogen-III C-methyltransferase [Sulfurovum zhangzhouensis]MDM5272757.1 uroporphyrinogen-III C-methyltransferase [Sulfurovum zhangzhouensis]